MTAQKKTPSKRANGTLKARVRKTAQPTPAEHTHCVLTEDEIARIAYRLWEDRGRPMGSPEEDWHRAKEQLSAG